jgi:hypothetical protein
MPLTDWLLSTQSYLKAGSVWAVDPFLALQSASTLRYGVGPLWVGRHQATVCECQEFCIRRATQTNPRQALMLS